MEKSSWFDNISRFFIPPDQGEHPLVRMSRIGADGLIQHSAHLPPTVQRARRTWSTVQEERERQKREEIYGRKLLGMVIPKIGERPIDKMNLLQQLIQQHQGPVVPSAISIDKSFDTGSLSSLNVGSIIPDGIYHEKKEPYMVPEAQIPLGVGDHPSLPNAQEIKQLTPIVEAASTPQPQPSPADTRTGFEKFVQSDFYKKLQDLFAGMSAAPSGGSGWDALASGVKQLNAGDKQRGQINQTVEYLKSKGYSEEEARFMAGNKDALNAFLLQKVNGGYDTKSKEELDRLRETIELKNRETISNNTLHDIERFMNYIEENGEWATGNAASIQAQLGVPQHRDMSSLLDSIKNRIGIDRLETMRQYSRNGASGFGNLTERELDILKSYLGEIKYNLGHKELLFRLKKIHEILGKMKSDVLSLLENGHVALTKENVDKVTSQPHFNAPQQGHSANAPVVKSAEEIEALPKGADFIVIDADGKRMTIRK
ncbi:hypothetical protein MCO_01095 [Bartonella sp. DB5-6]|uniref:hypothetical protein n=1 Tax=Bartonella sp. DB5-6 TaxID=1094755 RepID=UPI00026E8AE7|nr:hypothetical protein [Bartonella sp. DB5-6]EJF79529.1 hypothetical protein MCO_01095 [Bartonella sp. DB5-6]